MKAITVNYNLIFCMTMAASPTFKLLATALKALLHCQLKTFRQKDEAKQNKVVLNLLKSLVYLTILLNLLPYFGTLQNSWGQAPTWLAEHFGDEIIYPTLLIPLFYSYELTVSPKIPWTMWLHHGAPIVVCILGLSDGLFGGSKTEEADESSNSYVEYLFCYSSCLAVSLDCVFFLLLGLFNMAESAHTKELLIRCAVGPYCVTCTCINVATLSVLAYHREFMARSPTLEFAMWTLSVLIIPEQVLPLRTLLSMIKRFQKQAKQEDLDERGQVCTENLVFPGQSLLSTATKHTNPLRRRQSRRFSAM